MRMDLVFNRRVFKNGLVLATTLITCTALQANEQEEKKLQSNSDTSSLESAGAPQGSERATGAQTRSGTAHQQQQQEFVKKALKSGKMEVELGQLAQQNGQNQQVKSLGQALVRDHTMANQQLQQIAQSMNIQVSDQPGQGGPSGQAQTGQDQSQTQKQGQGQAHGHDAEKHAKHQQDMDKLRNQTGAEFDKEFVRMALKHHKKDIKEFEQAQQNAQDQQLTSFIQQTLPKLRQHLQMAQTAARAVGVDEAALSSDRDDSTGLGAPAAGERGSTPPGELKPRSSLDNNSDASISGAAQLGDREFSTDIDADVDTSDSSAAVDVDADVDDDGKIFEKGDGKILGLPTSKTDGKFLGIIPAPGGKDDSNDAAVSIEDDADTDEAVGSAAEIESGKSDSEVDVEVDVDREPK